MTLPKWCRLDRRVLLLESGRRARICGIYRTAAGVEIEAESDATYDGDRPALRAFPLASLSAHMAPLGEVHE
jgi:hypothetical protein